MSGCVTHHHACDCREKSHKAEIDALRTENEALRCQVEVLRDFLGEKMWEFTVKAGYDKYAVLAATPSDCANRVKHRVLMEAYAAVKKATYTDQLQYPEEVILEIAEQYNPK